MSNIHNNIIAELEALYEILEQRKQYDLLDTINKIKRYADGQESYIEELLQSLTDYEKRR